jgi:hypothetical protein
LKEPLLGLLRQANARIADGEIQEARVRSSGFGIRSLGADDQRLETGDRNSLSSCYGRRSSVVGCPCFNDYLALLSKLDGVTDEVGENLTQPVRVALYGGGYGLSDATG